MFLNEKIQNIYILLSHLLSQFKSICVNSLDNLPLCINKLIIGKNKLPFYTNATIEDLDLNKYNYITSIENYAFYKCSNLKEITIPNSVTEIGYEAFEGCDSLTNITIPTSVTSIDYAAFRNCINLQEIIIPNSITQISNSTFENCTNLNNVVLPESITTINLGAFRYCKSLVSITIPSSVTNIKTQAFLGCNNLTDIYLKPLTPPALDNTSITIHATVKIHVPIGSGEAYRSATNWSALPNIIIEDIPV